MKLSSLWKRTKSSAVSAQSPPPATAMTTSRSWNVKFLLENQGEAPTARHALIILNQPFSLSLLRRLWASTQWHCCADGGANRLYDAFQNEQDRLEFLPDLIKGDLDSIRPAVRSYYEALGVPVVQDRDENATDLMKCIAALKEKEKLENVSYHIIFLGGLSGRLDQTIHTLSYLHKLRKEREQVYVVTDDNVGWVLDEGEHHIDIEHDILGQTCGLLPVGIASTILSTTGLRWNLTNHLSSFGGMVSTSNHLVPEEKVVWIKTTEPIWWTVELKNI
ncbi:thiamine pyrophosphokinase Thi80 [Pholiota conissans]|uniref:Thiamine pyrophosphokinase n=1 Tax=Pholiota conissans TaxID=109636 RepID=A0A9P5YWD6_9AGAR|nr:thiamine pyrophosphokinase Thi80 [Pholiota conissans]